ncbi:MAG TPA: hypothetical protein ENK58_05110 [Desulfobacterales bacterium]|nr:MAG: hypothetical protein DRI57_17540 [Deltaproteobacteria bacterium]HHC24781.1 hypothetical protein [Desulfobacterales bacterium]
MTESEKQKNTLSYSKFSLDMVRRRFGIKISMSPVFSDIRETPPTDILKAILERISPLALVSEKARSEFIVAPVLMALHDILKQKISIYSGVRFDISPEEGLQGICDFIISKSPPIPTVQPPAIMMVEAKKNDTEGGLGQCASEMVAARRFNQEEGIEEHPVCGCVTTGELWQFLCLDGDRLSIDPDKKYIKELPKILGSFVQMINMT